MTAAADRHEQDVDLAAYPLQLVLAEPVPEVTQMTDAKAIDLDRVGEILSPFRALLGIVIRLGAGHRHALDLELAGTDHDVRLGRQSLQAEVRRIIVREDDDLHVQPDRRQAELGLVRVDHHGGLAAAKPHGVQAEIGDFHRPVVYIRSGEATPINPSALAMVVRAARESSSRAAVSGASSVTTRQLL